MRFDFNNLIWPGIIFIYFLSKDTVLSKIFKDRSVKFPIIYTFIITLAFIYLNISLQGEYDKYLNMSYVKGSIRLPNFSLLFILADFISSVIFIFFIQLKTGVHTIKSFYGRVIIDIFRLFFLYIIFSGIASFFWMKQTTRNMNFSYYCFQRQVAIDIAHYYLINKKIPSKLSDFTEFDVNPENDAQLVYQPSESIISTVVTDEKGNTIMAGYDHLIGISSYLDIPEKYFELQKATSKIICQDQLTFPTDY